MIYSFSKLYIGYRHSGNLSVFSSNGNLIIFRNLKFKIIPSHNLKIQKQLDFSLSFFFCIFHQVLFILGVARVDIPDWYIMLAFRLAALHSVINPWIYPLLRKRFRDSLVWHITTMLRFTTCCLISAPSYTLSKFEFP